jgi:hypothetical protein
MRTKTSLLPPLLASLLTASALLATLGCSGGSNSQDAPARSPATRKKQVAPQPRAAQAPPETERSRALTAEARILAGLPVDEGEPWTSMQARPAWVAHAKVLGNLWMQNEKARLSKVRAWADVQLPQARAGASSVFYPFGGPDALYSTTFFPDARTYVLVGLEPVGTTSGLANLSPEALDKGLKEMETYITPILQISFFRTNDMEEELAKEGTIPILMTFLAGTGHRILEVQPVALVAGGSAVEVEGPGRAARAVRIDFVREGAIQPQSLYYISQDLSDAALKKAPEFLDFLDKMDRPATFLKAATYLMFRDHFSKVRNFVLTRTSAVLEDDSGIPFRSFDRTRWDIRLYGTYAGPIRLFKDFDQKDLLDAYAAPGAALPLEFGIGYQHRAGESNLLLATQKR